GAPVQARDKPFPDSTAIPAHHQPMLPCTPVVEVPDYRYGLGRGGPYCKITAFLPLQFAQVRSQFFIEPKMFARLEEVDVEFCEKTMWDYLGHRGLFSIYNITHLCQRIPQVRPLCKRITVLCKNGTLFDFYSGTHLKTSKIPKLNIMNKINTILGAFTILFLVACEGEQGPPGFDGLDGLDGQDGIQGQVVEVE